jgi:hypothetical protein
MVAIGIGFGYWLPVEKVCSPVDVPCPRSSTNFLEEKSIDECVDRGHVLDSSAMCYYLLDVEV